MARDTLAGTRIRERRITLGLKQAKLAQQIGISPSYLNLIEHNRRRIGGKLLLQVADALNVEPTLLSEGAQATLIAALAEAATRAPEVPVEGDRSEEFAGRFPGWAELLVQQGARIDTLERTVETLTDRLAHDPQLAASLHEVLSSVTAIRSTAGILADPQEIAPQWRDRFLRNLDEDARRLAESSTALATYLDGVGDAEVTGTSPQEEVQAFLDRSGHHFAELEREGADPAHLLDAVASHSARFILARHFDTYQSDAAALPLEQMRGTLAEIGADPLALAARFGVRLDQIMRRLASLPAEWGDQTFGLVVVDATGSVLWHKAIDGFAVPKLGAGCAYWPVYKAFSTPNVAHRSLVRQAGKDPAVIEVISCAAPSSEPLLNRSPDYLAYMLLRPARDWIEGEVQEMGVTCRICDRAGCALRREPAILAEGF